YNRYDACDVRHGSIRSVLTDEQLRKLEGASRWQSFNAGEPIFEEGGKTTHSFIVMSGALKLTKLHPDGERHVVGLMFPDDLLSGKFKAHHTCSAEAATDLELCAMPLETVLSLCNEAPNLERVLFRAALCELEASHDWVLLLRGCSAYQRVAGFLRLLAKRAQPDGSAGPEQAVRFTLPLSRAEIAGFLGITIETVSRQMTLLRKTAVIELPASRDSREVIVPDLALLSAHAEGDFSGAGCRRTAQPVFANPAGAYPGNAL
ncbi:MAG: Crp/Fnr family transcriptional regulator, partial [Rhodomicrobium sp.]